MRRAVGPPGSRSGPEPAPLIYTVGHSNVALDDLVRLLQWHDIQVVADIRTSPRSRYVPHFDAVPLGNSLAEAAIRYVPLGDELGGRPEGDEFYDKDDHVLYGRLAASPAFLGGIDRVLSGARSYRIALLCSEEDPSKCHRHLLIGPVLRAREVALWHIRGDGRIETEDDLAAREADAEPQAVLFPDYSEELPWRSIRSVSRRRAPLSSSGP